MDSNQLIDFFLHSVFRLLRQSFVNKSKSNRNDEVLDNSDKIPDELVNSVKLNAIMMISQKLKINKDHIKRYILSGNYFSVYNSHSRVFTKLLQLLLKKLDTIYDPDTICHTEFASCGSFSLNSCSSLEVKEELRNNSILSSRLGRVFVSATYGGLLLSLSLKFAGPQIQTALTTLLGTSNPVGQVFLGIQSLLTIDSLAGLGMVGAVGAFFSGYKVFKRTGKIDEFVLEPLHYPTTVPEEFENHIDESKVDSSDNISDIYHPELVITPIFEYTDPVFILIPGFSDKNIDERVNWGADNVSIVNTNLQQRPVSIEDSEVWTTVAASSIGWFKELFPIGEALILFWATNCLQDLKQVCEKCVQQQLMSFATDLVLQFTPLSPIMNVSLLPRYALDMLTDLDEPWLTTIDKATQAGKLLAQTLIHQQAESFTRTSQLNAINPSITPGCRPVTLISYGMGCRVLFECLYTLANAGVDMTGLIENAVFIGAPVGFGIVDMSSGLDFLNGHEPKWRAIRKIVSGRLINCYSSRDWILALLFRRRGLELQVAGLEPVILRKNENLNGMKKGDNLSYCEQLAKDMNTPPIMPSEKQASSSGKKSFDKMFQADEIVEDWISESIEQLSDIENVNVTDLISSQMDYPHVLSSILARLHLEI